MFWKTKNCDKVSSRLLLALHVSLLNDAGYAGLKEYSDWPTIPQLYLQKEFVGGCDILMSMHQNGELAKMLEKSDVLVPADEAEAPKEP